MCKDCTATEGTFREVIATFGGRSAICGDIVYVVRAGRCHPRDDFALDTARDDRSWNSEVLGSKGLSWVSARWVLCYTKPA